MYAKEAGTNWIALYVKNNECSYFGSFGIEFVLKEVLNFVKNKHIKTNIYRI